LSSSVGNVAIVVSFGSEKKEAPGRCV